MNPECLVIIMAVQQGSIVCVSRVQKRHGKTGGRLCEWLAQRHGDT